MKNLKWVQVTPLQPIGRIDSEVKVSLTFGQSWENGQTRREKQESMDALGLLLGRTHDGVCWPKENPEDSEILNRYFWVIPNATRKALGL